MAVVKSKAIETQYQSLLGPKTGEMFNHSRMTEKALDTFAKKESPARKLAFLAENRKPAMPPMARYFADKK